MRKPKIFDRPRVTRAAIDAGLDTLLLLIGVIGFWAFVLTIDQAFNSGHLTITLDRTLLARPTPPPTPPAENPPDTIYVRNVSGTYDRVRVTRYGQVDRVFACFNDETQLYEECLLLPRRTPLGSARTPILLPQPPATPSKGTP